MATVKEVKESACAGTGTAAISAASNGTSVGVLALVRTRRFSEPLSTCADEAGIHCPNPRLAKMVIRVMGRETSLLCHFEAEGVSNCLEAAATDLGVETVAGKGDARQTNGSASGKADEGPRESTACAR